MGKMTRRDVKNLPVSNYAEKAIHYKNVRL
jgi:hypothetical protein